MNPKDMLNRLTADEFRKNNGIVMRGISIAFPMRWFEEREILVVSGDQIDKHDLKKSLVYLADEGYLKYRKKGTGEIPDIMDVDTDELEFRTSPKGTRLIECVAEDSLIEM